MTDSIPRALLTSTHLCFFHLKMYTLSMSFNPFPQHHFDGFLIFHCLEFLECFMSYPPLLDIFIVADSSFLIYFLITIFFPLFIPLCSLWDLNSLTRDGIEPVPLAVKTWSPKPLDLQGIPLYKKELFFIKR